MGRRFAALTCGAIVAAACALVAPRARAAPAADRPTIVLESHVGQRSTEAATALTPLLDELERRGFAARAGTIDQQLGTRAPRPGVLDAGKTSAEMIRQVHRGLDGFTTGDFKQARAILAEAVQQLRRNPAVVVVDPDGASAMFQAMVGLALSQGRLGETAASVATMTELIRAFPAQPVSRAQYGPEAEQLYRTAEVKTRSVGRGRLAIIAGDTQAKIFVDDKLRGTTKVSLSDLRPGSYSIYVQRPGAEGRQYEVPVAAGEDSVLEIDGSIDPALTVSERWVGLVFASDAERANEIRYASALARRWSYPSIAVVGAARAQGEPAVIATLVGAGGEVIRSGMVATGGDDDAKLRSLARFIADGTPSQDVLAVTGAHTTVAARRSSLVGKLLVGGGLAMLAASAVLLMVDQDQGHTNEQGDQTELYRDTAPFSIATGVAGLASLGVGVWLLVHREHGSSAPVVSIGPSSGFLGWTGQF